MPRVAIVTDTTGYLPADVAEANQITEVSLYINWGGDRTERDADITDIDAFMEELRRGDHLPTTSQPSVGDFMAAYEPLLADGADVVSVHISGGISGTVESARQAAQQLEREGKGGERVHVFDSASAAGGQGIVTLGAARSALRGNPVEQVLADTQATRDALKMWFAVDTLEFLKRSGRIGGAAALIGTTLKIKPILTLEAEITPVERVRTSKRAFERMVDYARQRKDSGADGWVVQHIRAEEQAQRLVDAVREVMGNEPVFVSEVGPVLAAHAGPGMIGVGGVPRHMLLDD
jgi:DegV family protein with EDD domain